MTKRALAAFFALIPALALCSVCKADDFSRPEAKQELIHAAAAAVRIEMRGYNDKLRAAENGTGPKENAGKWRARVEELKGELDRFVNLAPADYPAPAADAAAGGLPEAYGPILPPLRREIDVTVGETGAALGGLLEADGATRSGPFYRLAGIKGGCPCALKAGRRYHLTVFLVYRREYFSFIQDCYIYIADYKETGAAATD